MRFTIIFMALLGVLSPVSASSQEQMQRQITVSGEGVVAVRPDMAVVRLGVQREGRAATQAMDGMSAALKDVLAAVEKAGIAPKDVQTSGLSLNPRWQHSNNGTPPRITGYVASSTLTVRVRALDDLGALLDAVVGDGANTLSGVSFSVAETGPLEDEARSAAVQNARAKAELLAAAAGVILGDILEISETGGAAPPQPMMRMEMAASSSVPVAAGEIEYRESVMMIFAIEN